MRTFLYALTAFSALATLLLPCALTVLALAVLGHASMFVYEANDE